MAFWLVKYIIALTSCGVCVASKGLIRTLSSLDATLVKYHSSKTPQIHTNYVFCCVCKPLALGQLGTNTPQNTLGLVTLVTNGSHILWWCATLRHEGKRHLPNGIGPFRREDINHEEEPQPEHEPQTQVGFNWPGRLAIRAWWYGITVKHRRHLAWECAGRT